MAGGNSTAAISGYDGGTYYPVEPPQAAFDGNLITDYTNHGSCTTDLPSESSTCGERTGVYFTLNTGPIILMAFYMGTNHFARVRDPLTITIEGSNRNGSVLTYGSSWTLIYNGTTELLPITNHSALEPLQILSTFPTPFASYRLLITSQRGVETCVSYSEFRLIGY